MRVIAGDFGGRRLHAPRGRNTRPTSDRVREALFMRLEPLAGRVVADLYAGSGALGLEALSRGAAFVHFVESDRHALDALRANRSDLGVEERSKIWPVRLPGHLVRWSEVLATLDLVLADPPYGGTDARRMLEALGAPGRLRTGARVVLERHAKDDVPARVGALEREDARQYGETVVEFYRALAPPAEDPS